MVNVMSGRPSVTAQGRRLTTPDRSLLVLIGVALVLSATVLWVMKDAIIDDGYINLGYVRMLSEHFEWGMLPGTPSNTATSPANVIVTAAVALVVGSPMAAMWVVTLATSVALAVGLDSLGGLWGVGRKFAWIALVFILANPLLASSLALETTAAVTLMVWLLARAAAGDWRGYGWLCGFGLLLRMDLVFVMGIIWLLHPALRRPLLPARVWGTTWRASAIALPWFAFSWFYFGSAIPDTFAMKTEFDGWGGPFLFGLQNLYLPLYGLAVRAVYVLAAASLVALVALPAFARTKFRPALPQVASAGAAGLAYLGFYCYISVSPYVWYYGIPLGAGLLVLAWTISATSITLFARRGVNWVRVAAGVAATALFATSVASWQHDLSRHLPLREAPIHGNWALTPEYKRIGLDLAERLPEGAVVRSAGEFAIILYYCDCTLIDRFDDRALIEGTLLNAKYNGSPLMRLNYRRYDPSDYPRTRSNYHLEYRRGWTDDPFGWNVFSPTQGRGHYLLLEGPRGSGLAEPESGH
jgi:hypothetical protein